MQLKPIAAIIVLLLLVATLSVAGCTSSSSSSTVSTDYPTSGRSKLVEGAVEQIRSSAENDADSTHKLQAFTVTWINDTQAQTHEELLDTQTFDVSVKDITLTHFPTTDDATAYYVSNNSVYTFTGSWPYGPIDYYKLTGKVPTVVWVNRDSWGENGIAQYDALVVEMTSSTITK